MFRPNAPLVCLVFALSPACGDDGGPSDGDSTSTGAPAASSGPGATSILLTTTAAADSSSGSALTTGEPSDDSTSVGTTGSGGDTTDGGPPACEQGAPVGTQCHATCTCAEGLVCGLLIDVPGVFEVSTCGECASDEDCTDQLCVPRHDIANLRGSHYCADPMSVADNEGCNLMGDGSECLSGQCAPAMIMGILVAGACSPCNEGKDCESGECQLPEITIEGTSVVFVPGFCVAPS